MVQLLPTLDTGICWGAFNVLWSGIYLVLGDKRMLPVCPPVGLQEVQLIKIFLKYADEHPEQLHQEFTLVALNSLTHAFPCK
jgi:hypothetical protein